MDTPAPVARSLVRVEKVGFRGSGVVILTGPSSCGKGEVAAALCRVLSIDKTAHLSMGEILRSTLTRAKTDPSFVQTLAERYSLTAQANIFSCIDSSDELTRKVQAHVEGLERYFRRRGMGEFTSQLEWLEYCVMNGLLVPNRWTQSFIAAHLEHDPRLRQQGFILDGYPRTVAAAKHLLELLSDLKIPVAKVLHLSISKQEMIARAKLRGREDDDEQALLSRYQFYVESVQPSVDFLKVELGSERVALIDAHQPVYWERDGQRSLNLQASIQNVVVSALRAMGVPRVVIGDLLSVPA